MGIMQIKLKDFGFNVEPLSFLPPIYAGINAITALLLVAAVVAIKNGNRKRHELLMKSAIACSLLFLVMTGMILGSAFLFLTDESLALALAYISAISGLFVK